MQRDTPLYLRGTPLVTLFKPPCGHDDAPNLMSDIVTLVCLLFLFIVLRDCVRWFLGTDRLDDLVRELGTS